MTPSGIKDQVEHATAQNFIAWYNQQTGRNLTLLMRQEAPDFICTDDIGQVGLEITTSYYNQNHAAFISKAVRGHHSDANHFGMRDPEKALIASINFRIVKKSTKQYGNNCFLIIRVICAGLTSNQEFEDEIVPSIVVPEGHQFSEIYLTMDQQRYVKLS